MTDKLSRFLTAGSHTHSVYYVIEAALKQRQKVFTCDAFLIVGCYIVFLKLLFLNTVVTACSLLFSQVLTVFLYGLAACSVLTGNGCAAGNCTLICQAAVSFEEKLLSFSAAKLAGRSSISCQTFLSSLLIIRGGAWEGGSRYEG